MRKQGCDTTVRVCPKLQHTYLPPAQETEMLEWLLGHRRKRDVKSITLTTDGYVQSAMRWISIDAIEQESSLARLRATLDGGRLTVSTGNVAGYSVDFSHAPVEAGVQRIEVVENGDVVGEVSMDGSEPVFRRVALGFDEAVFRKRRGMCGPISALFSQPCLVVTGCSQQDKGVRRAYENAADTLKKAKSVFDVSEVVPDQLLTMEQARSSHLILLGTAQTNRWLGRTECSLPIRVENGRIIAGEDVFDGNGSGFVAIHPSPWASGRYVLAISSEDPLVVEALARALVDDPAGVGYQDVLVGERSADRRGVRWRMVERWNWAWRWPARGRVVTRLNEAHPDWQWAQFVGKVVQELPRATFFSRRMRSFCPWGI